LDSLESEHPSVNTIHVRVRAHSLKNSKSNNSFTPKIFQLHIYQLAIPELHH
jgi:hypothetical protein